MTRRKLNDPNPLRFWDWAGREVKVGSRVIFGTPDEEDPASVKKHTGEVIGFTMPELDVDDDTGEERLILPTVQIKLGDGTREQAEAIAAGYGDVWQAD